MLTAVVLSVLLVDWVLEQASTREEAARWVEVLKVLQTMDEEESKVCAHPRLSP